MSQRWNVDHPQIVEILSDFCVPGFHEEIYAVHTSNLPASTKKRNNNDLLNKTQKTRRSNSCLLRIVQVNS